MVEWEIVVVGKPYSELNGQGRFKEMMGKVVEYIFSIDRVQREIDDELFTEVDVSVVFPQKKIYVELKPALESVKEDE